MTTRDEVLTAALNKAWAENSKIRASGISAPPSPTFVKWFTAGFSAAMPSQDGTQSPQLDPVVEANRALLHERSQVGIRKYGVTLGDVNLSERELMVHALQESLDLANYLQAQLQRIDAAPTGAKLASIADDSKFLEKLDNYVAVVCHAPTDTARRMDMRRAIFKHIDAFCTTASSRGAA